MKRQTPRTERMLTQLGSSGSTSRFAEFARELEREVSERGDLLRELEDRRWQPMTTAPKSGRPVDILVKVNRANTPGVLVVHWAFGGGDDQPRFGPGWFFWDGRDFQELTQEPSAWMRLPETE